MPASTAEVLSDFQVVELPFLPGFYTEAPARGAPNRWKTGDNVRFHKVSGLPQKMGGVQKNTASAFLGVCRGLLDLQTLDGVRYIALGTSKKLYLFRGGTLSDITPYRRQVTLGANPITTTNGSAIVTVHDVGHGATVGDYVTFGGATAVNGVTLSGTKNVLAVTDADNYTVNSGTTASGGSAGGGAAVTAKYEINLGGDDATAGFGWGVGGFGSGTFGTARSVSTFYLPPRTWAVDQWGEDLIACPWDGKIYTWDASSGVGTRATVISAAPSTVLLAYVSTEDRHLIAFGCTGVDSIFDPLLIRWCTREDYTDWTPAEDNDAGGIRLKSDGTKILAAIRTRGEFLVLTDYSAHSLFFIGGNDAFDVKSLGGECGIAGPNAGIDVGGVVYYMGTDNRFWTYDGSLRELRCEVLNYVFGTVADPAFNFTQRAKVYVVSNAQFGEVTWYYPSAGSDENDRYVTYNVTLKCWYYGTRARTAGDDKSDTLGSAFATSPDGYIYQHEQGVDENTAAMSCSLESHDLEVANGSRMVRVRRIIPDFSQGLDGTIDLTLKTKKWPNQANYRAVGPRTIAETTLFVNFKKAKGRQIAMLWESDAVGDDWKMGIPRALIRDSGDH